MAVGEGLVQGRRAMRKVQCEARGPSGFLREPAPQLTPSRVATEGPGCLPALPLNFLQWPHTRHTMAADGFPRGADVVHRHSHPATAQVRIVNGKRTATRAGAGQGQGQGQGQRQRQGERHRHRQSTRTQPIKRAAPHRRCRPLLQPTSKPLSGDQRAASISRRVVPSA
jgi:hypothetical protein